MPTSVPKPFVALKAPWRKENDSSRAEWKSHFAPAVDRQPWSPRGKLFHSSVASSPSGLPELTECPANRESSRNRRPVYQLHARIRSLQTRVFHGDLDRTSSHRKQTSGPGQTVNLMSPRERTRREALACEHPQRHATRMHHENVKSLVLGPQCTKLHETWRIYELFSGQPRGNSRLRHKKIYRFPLSNPKSAGRITSYVDFSMRIAHLCHAQL